MTKQYSIRHGFCSAQGTAKGSLRHRKDVTASLMELPPIFSATLGISRPWQITSVAFAAETPRLDITVTFDPAGDCACPCCGSRGEACHAESADEVWFHPDFFRYATYLHTRVPRIRCRCGVHAVERPWSRSGSRFVKIGAGSP